MSQQKAVLNSVMLSEFAFPSFQKIVCISEGTYVLPRRQLGICGFMRSVHCAVVARGPLSHRLGGPGAVAAQAGPPR